ncbi:hypothetical protein IFR05_002463 [Cadophora sp. M221]|nr:hypothetical protein IFR05_002463 [Cadophora sp. M221]
MWRNSSSMLPFKLHFAGTLGPGKPSNMTAVCWSVPELDIARIALYFVSSFPDPVTKYAIIETIVDIYTTNFTLVDYPAFSDTHRMVTRVLDKSSLVAVVLPSEGVRLYYQEKPKDSKKIGISELSRGWPTPPLIFQDSIEASRHLDVDARGTGTPLTAAAVDTNDGTRLAEVHIFFVDKKSRLSRVLRVGSETYPPQPLAERFNSGGWTIPIQRMTAIIPHINNGIPEPDLFFIRNERITDIFGAAEIPSGYTASNAPFVYIQNSGSARLEPDGTSTMPEAVQTPPLIAVTCWNFRDDRTMGVDVESTAENRVRMQIFYVKLDKGPYGSERTYDNVTKLGDGIKAKDAFLDIHRP